jgi:hypothetical protein
VDCGAYSIQQIQDVILELKGNQEKFDDRELRDFLHLVSAVQSNADVKNYDAE